MKKIIYLYLAVYLLFSCNDFLNREPIDEVSINKQLSTKNGVLEALNGAYYQTRSSMFTLPVFYYGDLLSGNTTFIPNNSGNFIVFGSVDAIYDFDDESETSELTSYYGTCYEIINNLNLILERVDALTDASVDEIKQIKAEALALRAFHHFQLLKYYSQNYSFTQDASHLGIVYNTNVLKVGIDYPIRKSNKECVELLEKDISEALSLYQQGKKAIPAGEQYHFMNVNAAKTLAAEISLYKNDFTKAISYSNDIIQNSGLSLTPSSDVSSFWGESERIWDLPKTAENQSPLKNIYNRSSSENRVSVSLDLYDLYEANDNRKNVLLEKVNLRTTVNGSSLSLPYYFTKKYTGKVNGLIYRLSELYFIRAEAAYKLGNITQALSDINQIRNRAGLSSLSTITLDEILLEKRKEFLCENKYFWDLMRNKKNIIRVKGCLSNNCSPTYPNNKFVMPIPISSLNLNSKMQQNPGY